MNELEQYVDNAMKAGFAVFDTSPSLIARLTFDKAKGIITGDKGGKTVLEAIKDANKPFLPHLYNNVVEEFAKIAGQHGLRVQREESSYRTRDSHNIFVVIGPKNAAPA